MSPDLSQFVPLLILAPLLIHMAFHDLRHLKISNRLVLAMLAIFLLSAPAALSFAEIGYRAAAAAVVFLLGFFGFAFRLWGGGDVKAMAALTLFVPSAFLSIFALVFSLSMAFGMAAVLTGQRVFGRQDSAWSALRPGSAFPMGVSIALSGLLLPLGLVLIPL